MFINIEISMKILSIQGQIHLYIKNILNIPKDGNQIRKSKNIQYNGQKKNYQTTNTTQKLNIERHAT